MPPPDEQLHAAVMAAVPADAMASCVVYVALTPVAAGSRLAFPRVSLECPSDALLAFVDLDPMANWSHPARYLLVDRSSAEVTAVDAHLPPFPPAGADDPCGWRVLYQAPSVPDALLAAPRL